MSRPLEIVATIVLGLIALACLGGLIASFVLDGTPDPAVLVALSTTLGTAVGAVAGIVTIASKGSTGG